MPGWAGRRSGIGQSSQVPLVSPVARSNVAAMVPPARYRVSDVPVTRCHEWNTLTDKCWNNVDVEFIDLVGVEERGDQFATAHHPDVFSWHAA